jgi:Zn-dependent protease
MFDSQLLAEAPLWYVAFLLSVTCHEAAHAWAALRLGDDTASRGGQVTLNPMPHIQREPLGMVVVPLVSLFLGGWMIGWASAPYDPYWQQRYPRRAAWMSLAGPAANFVLVAIASLAMVGGMMIGIFDRPEGFSMLQMVAPTTLAAGGLATFLSILFVENVLLGAFNLIPVPPLDGATAIGLILPESAALAFLNFMRQPGFSLLGLVIAWRAFDYVFPPVYSVALQVFYFSVNLFT